MAHDSTLKYGIAISHDGEQIAYGKSGSGDTALVLIHGWSLDSRLWQNQLSEFSEQYQVITMDLAGHGNSSFNREEYTMVAFAEDVKGVVSDKVCAALYN